jgi:voltage-gated potassium channel
VRNCEAVSDLVRETRLDRLRSVSLFASIGDDGLHRILECANEFEAPAGHVLVEVRMPGSGLFVIEDGTAVVEVPGHPIELGPGESFGELSLLIDHERAARVRAKTSIRCLAISRHDFDRLLESEPRLAIAMLRELAARLVAFTTH